MSERPAFWNPAEEAAADDDPRLRAPAVARNRDAILAVLRDILPPRGTVLEIASGSGEHAVHFARAFPGLAFQPSDPGREALASIAAWSRGEAGLTNLLEPMMLDATAETWPALAADAILCINMIHIAPWSAAQGLFRHAGALLRSGAPLYLYGPFRRSDQPLEDGNAAFDASLRRRDPRWGLRDLDAVIALAERSGFSAPVVVAMPANNLSLIFRKR